MNGVEKGSVRLMDGHQQSFSKAGLGTDLV